VEEKHNIDDSIPKGVTSEIITFTGIFVIVFSIFSITFPIKP